MQLNQNFSGAKAKRILVFSYAFPPMQVQMTPVVARMVAALKFQNFAVDVLAAENFLPFIPSDNSLVPYVKTYSDNIHYISPSNRKWRNRDLNWFTADIMTILENSAYNNIMSLNLEDYEAVITFSPFHSINKVMLRVKKNRPKIRWIAHFCDPWAGNPLEKDWFRILWNEWYEPKMLAVVDLITHSSKFTLEVILNRHKYFDRSKASLIPHFFDVELYPKRPKANNTLVTLRFVGTLFGRRSPESLFQAVLQLLVHRIDLQEAFVIELIGKVEPAILESKTSQSLPQGLVRYLPPVDYLKSLELMYDADILLLIEADTDLNLFVPSKLADYMGANTPIVGIANTGGSREILDGLGCWTASPHDIQSIEKILESSIDYVLNGCQDPWHNPDFKDLFSLQSISKKLSNLI